MAQHITGEIKELITIHIKPRHDHLCDQYSRIFMVKLLMVCTVIIGVNQYRDTISCIIPESLDICNGDEDPDTSCDFIHAACWIQGLYVYNQLIDRVSDVAYYGMPKNIDNDGYINGTTDLCMTEPKLGEQPSENCIPMDRTFYLQYQWMAFFVGSLALMYYLPYVMFCKVNEDFISLKNNLKSKILPNDQEREIYAEQIRKSFFKKTRSAQMNRKLRPSMNLLVKILYVCSNFISFFALDNVLNGEFAYYGKRWTDWSLLPNTLMYDYMGMRDFPKPGNRLLPPFGYCEFYESARDIKTSKANKFKIVCEISQHILYQYCLILLWFCLVIGMGVSLLGFLHMTATYLSHWLETKNKGNKYKGLSLREMEYLKYIKARDKTLCRKLMQKLKDSDFYNNGEIANLSHHPSKEYRTK